MTARVGDWMQLYSGGAFWPLDPRPEDVTPLDIAHALSHLCRFGGHVKRFYSVAEHCVLMSYAVERDIALWALLHDASEAYVVDLPRPIKRHMPDYRIAEAGVMDAIVTRFAIDAFEPPGVKDADNRILLDERAALLGPPPLSWGADLEQLEPLGVTITGWRPEVARVRYLTRLSELGAL